MATIQFKLSVKENKESGKHEILIRFFNGKVFNVQSGSGIYVSEKHFEHEINRKACEKAGIRVPSKMITITSDEAEKKGYFIFDRGQIVIRERIENDDTKKDRLAKDRLDQLAKIIEDSFLNDGKDAIDSNWLRNTIDRFNHPDKFISQAEKDAAKSIYELGDQFIQHEDYSISVIKHFKGVLRNMARYEAFVRIMDKKPNENVWNIASIDRERIEDFRNYLRNEHQLQNEHKAIFKRLLEDYPSEINVIHKSPKINKRGEITINKMLKLMRRLFKWMISSGITSNNPFDQIKIESERYHFDPVCLTTDERDAIANYDLSDHPALEAQRDIFIFQCLVGCRVSDLIRLNESNVLSSRDADGNEIKVLEYTPIKTKKETSAKPRIPLNQSALSLIAKYKGIDRKGRLFPFISDQKYNIAIKAFMKEMFEKDGILGRMVIMSDESDPKPLYQAAASHLARRTFVNTAYQIERDPAIVCKMSGHKEDSKSFARYRKISDQTTAITTSMMEIKSDSDDKPESASDPQESASAIGMDKVISLINSSSLSAKEKAEILKAMISSGKEATND